MQNAVEKAKSAQTLDEWKENGHLFHIALAESCENKILISLFKSIEEPTRKMLNEHMDENKMAKCTDSYQMILDAIAQNDTRKASKLMADLLK